PLSLEYTCQVRIWLLPTSKVQPSRVSRATRSATYRDPNRPYLGRVRTPCPRLQSRCRRGSKPGSAHHRSYKTRVHRSQGVILMQI
ncbi:hypothetical protein PoMZ_04739, partial [Pyricularia oryzae]